MTYCACAVSSIIGNVSGIDIPSARDMINRCQVRWLLETMLIIRHGKEATQLDQV